jgi:mRNA-degrading endonuclease toxin of MazEF toxin-antitoxin module
VSESYRTGDVFWAPDPFRSGSNPRLWLVLSAERLPYPGEEYICAALTTSDLPANYEVADAWETGRNPEKTSYCSPWVVGTIKHRAVASPQGAIAATFTEQMAEQAREFLTDDR